MRVKNRSKLELLHKLRRKGKQRQIVSYLFEAFLLLRGLRSLGILIRLHFHSVKSCIARFDSYDFGIWDL